METETKRPSPKRHYEPKLSLYPMKFEDAVKKLARAGQDPKKEKPVHSAPANRASKFLKKSAIESKHE